jgi:hypothetical protein
MKQQLEKVKQDLDKLNAINPDDIRLNKELDSSIQWIESALIRLEAREDGNCESWYVGEP